MSYKLDLGRRYNECFNVLQFGPRSSRGEGVEWRGKKMMKKTNTSEIKRKELEKL